MFVKKEEIIEYFKSGKKNNRNFKKIKKENKH